MWPTTKYHWFLFTSETSSFFQSRVLKWPVQSAVNHAILYLVPLYTLFSNGPRTSLLLPTSEQNLTKLNWIKWRNSKQNSRQACWSDNMCLILMHIHTNCNLLNNCIFNKQPSPTTKTQTESERERGMRN